MTVTLTTTSDINPIDDIEWAVDVGDYLYYGLNRDEIRINITKIVNVTIEDHGITLLFQEVWANLSMWRNNQWENEENESIIGRANEYFPMIMYDDEDGEDEDSYGLPLLLPKGFKLADVLKLYENMANDDYRFDSATLEDGWIKQYNSSTKGFVKFFYNDGIVELIQAIDFEFMTDDGKLGDNVLYLKNSTFIDTVKPIWEFDIRTLGTEAFNVSLNISVKEDTHLLTSAFSVNPINISLNYRVLFIDV